MTKVFYYPPASRSGYENPYSVNFKRSLSRHFYVCDSRNKPAKMLTLSLLIYSFYADIFVLNWLESAPFLALGRVQYLFALLSLFVIKLRKKKIIWVLHNIHPHDGSNGKSSKIQKRLFAESSIVVCHSKEAFDFARKNANGKCLFFNHPVQRIEFADVPADKKNIDVLIWGNILPYKGVYEFLSNSEVQNSNLNILVLGVCRDEILTTQIESCCSGKIIFENRKADYNELHSVMQSCRYVLFPYIGKSVSSSGALIDTLVLGGTPVGPKVGAFSDLSEMNVCLAYRDFSELKQILQSNVELSKNSVNAFLKNNSWNGFVDRLFANMR